jgi:hypothetical protein
MKIDHATLHVLNRYPEFYLQAEDILFVEATNISAEIVTRAHFRELLDKLETKRLVISTPVHDVVKWKITAAGRAWLKES